MEALLILLKHEIIGSIHELPFLWLLLGEKFPSFDNPENYYNDPALRRDADETLEVNSELLNDKHTLLYLLVRFMSGKSKKIDCWSLCDFTHSKLGTQKRVIAMDKDNVNYFQQVIRQTK